LPTVSASNAGEFFGLSFANISYATLVTGSTYVGSYNGFDWIFIDNFKYNGENHGVPEPATILLLGAGLMGLAPAGERSKIPAILIERAGPTGPALSLLLPSSCNSSTLSEFKISIPNTTWRRDINENLTIEKWPLGIVPKYR
jgi:hypothetical protein